METERSDSMDNWFWLEDGNSERFNNIENTTRILLYYNDGTSDDLWIESDGIEDIYFNDKLKKVEFYKYNKSLYSTYLYFSIEV